MGTNPKRIITLLRNQLRKKIMFQKKWGEFENGEKDEVIKNKKLKWNSIKEITFQMRWIWDWGTLKKKVGCNK